MTMGRAVLFSGVYFLLSSLLFYATSFVQGIDTQSETFRLFYSRGESFDTTVFPLSTLLFYLGSNILGIAYINVANLNYYRNSLFMNKHGTYSSLYWTLLLTPLFFVASVLIMLRSPDSLSSKPCEVNDVSCQGKPYSFKACYFYNVIVWNFGYVFGLCMTYFKLCKLEKFNLVPS